jgi:putative membrane protein
MRLILPLILTAASLAAAWSQEPGSWGMHDRLDWGMWFGPLFMLAPLALVIIAVVVLIRWLGGRTAEGGSRGYTRRDILDKRYARGEIDREEYLRRRDDISGRL